MREQASCWEIVLQVLGCLLVAGLVMGALVWWAARGDSDA